MEHRVILMPLACSLAAMQCRDSTPNLPKMQFKFTPISQIEQIESNNLIGLLSHDTASSPLVT